MKKIAGIKVSVFFILALSIILSCTTREKAAQKTKPPKPKNLEKVTVLTDSIKVKEAELDRLRLETEALLASLREKESRLNSRKAQLDSLETELDNREESLMQSEKALKDFRVVTYFIFIFGIVCLGVSVIILLGKKESGAKEPPKITEEKPDIKPEPPQTNTVQTPDSKKTSSEAVTEKPKTTTTRRSTGRTAGKTTAGGQKPAASRSPRSTRSSAQKTNNIQTGVAKPKRTRTPSRASSRKTSSTSSKEKSETE